MKPVVVVGGMNVDLVSKTQRFPRAGETVVGHTFYRGFGGKAANQAVQIARLGMPVDFVGCVGDDAFGEEMIECMQTQGIGTQHMKVAKGFSSGTAMIIVDSDAQNQIVVVSGANYELKPEDIAAAEQTIARAGLVVLPFDIPFETVRETIRVASGCGVPIIANPAPAVPDRVDSALLKNVEVLVPNETEAEALTGVSAQAADFATSAADRLIRMGARTVIVTLGEKGCLLAGAEGHSHIPGFEVRAEDTTAAGDAFVGALAAGYQSLPDAHALARFASAVAALSVTRRGAQSSLPKRKEVDEFLLKNDRDLHKLVEDAMS